MGSGQGERSGELGEIGELRGTKKKEVQTSSHTMNESWE